MFIFGGRMVIYFSRSKKTEVFAKILSDVKQMPLFQLSSDLNEMRTFPFIFKALWLVIRDKSHPVKKIPESIPEEIYVCSPVWGGKVAAPVKFFLQNAELSNTKINILLTASTPTDKYVKNAEKLLQNTSCIPGNVNLFAANSKEDVTDVEIIKEHMKELM